MGPQTPSTTTVDTHTLFANDCILVLFRFYTSSQQFSPGKCLLLDSRNRTQCWCNNWSSLCVLEELNIGVLSKRSDAKFASMLSICSIAQKKEL